MATPPRHEAGMPPAFERDDAPPPVPEPLSDHRPNYRLGLIAAGLAVIAVLLVVLL